MRVLQTFPELVPFPLAIHDTGLIFSHTFNSQNTIGLREPACVHGGIGKVPEDEDTEDDSDGAIDYEEPHPWAVVFVLNVAKTIAKEATQHLGNSKPHIPPCSSLWLLITSIPLRGKNHECWIDTGLDNAQKSAADHQGSKTAAGGYAHEDHSPLEQVGVNFAL